MKIKKRYKSKEIVIKYDQLDYSITVNELIYKKFVYFFCGDEIIIMLIETSKYISFNKKNKDVILYQLESEVRYANYIDESIFLIDSDNMIWTYDLEKKRFEKRYSLRDLSFYEISAAIIKKNYIYVYDNYTYSCYMVNLKDDSFKSWKLKREIDGFNYFINRINRIKLSDGINLYWDDKKYATIKKNEIFYGDINGNRLHYPRAIFEYNNILGVCNTYANEIILIDTKYKKMNSDFKIKKPRWMDIEGGFFAICDGFDQKIIYGEINGYTLKMKKELYGFSDIHSCKIIKNIIYVIDADNNCLITINMLSGEMRDYEMNLKDAHSIKASVDRKKMAITDSGNSRIISLNIDLNNVQNINSIDIEGESKEFYMPRALTFLDSDILIFTVGYNGEMVFYDINNKKVIKNLIIKEISLYIDKARDMIVDKNRKSIFFSLTEQSKVVQVKFSKKLNKRNINNVEYTEMLFYS